MLLPRDVQVLVAGAGPAGLFTALTLARRGVRVAVVDEQPRTTARTYACALHPRSLDLLEDAGLAGELIAGGQRLDGVAFYEGPVRRVEARYSALPGKHPFLLIVPQQALEDALEKHLKAEGVPVLWSHRLGRVTVEGGVAHTRIERLELDSSGYSVQTAEWVVDREEEAELPFVVGADGHRSLVRRGLGIDLVPVGDPQLFAVWEFAGQGPELREVRVILSGGRAGVLWPLGQGWYRFGFELDAAEQLGIRREKSRQVALAGDPAQELLDRSWLEALAAERAPWFEVPIETLAWSAPIRFERKLASSFGRGAAWILGDAAHLAPPVSMQSMNAGLFEARTLAEALEAVLRAGSPRARLLEWGQQRRSEMERLLSCSPSAGVGADAFVQSQARVLADCLPISGDDRPRMLQQLALET
ncbi:MAG: FAD-dependent monooxygenase [Deltaproteobacteria bacterium]|nr:FAD-dependent monooxygenase [Deltaproteobacteria bacterium]